MSMGAYFPLEKPRSENHKTFFDLVFYAFKLNVFVSIWEHDETKIYFIISKNISFWA